MKTTQLVYEWAIEQTDEYGDIQNVDHADTYAEATAQMNRNPADDGLHYELALTRCVVDDILGLQDRVYAYVKDGKLPEYFEGNEHKVPQRFHQEVSQ